MITKAAGDDEDYTDWEYTVGVPSDETPIRDVVTRAEQELFACGEFGDDVRPETMQALLKAVRTMQSVLADAAIDQHMRENGYTHLGPAPAKK